MPSVLTLIGTKKFVSVTAAGDVQTSAVKDGDRSAVDVSLMGVKLIGVVDDDLAAGDDRPAGVGVGNALVSASNRECYFCRPCKAARELYAFRREVVGDLEPRRHGAGAVLAAQSQYVDLEHYAVGLRLEVIVAP